ncbi:MAG: DUF4230 domain-containing protein [Polyangiaceae bacterium]
MEPVRAKTDRSWARRLGVAAAFVAVALGAGILAQKLDLSPRLLAPGATHSVTVVRPSPNVVTAIRELSRLESAEYHVERVLDVKDHQTRLYGLIEGDDALLLVVSGDVVAGVDLGAMKESDVEVDRQAGRVRVKLPPPEIFSARLDSEKTYVHTRRTDLFARTNAGLESEARARAEKELAGAAKEAKILERASASASRTVQKLVEALGFRSVEIVVERA